MVAYSFMKEFAPLVESGAKLHTIRDDKKNGRHAKKGSELQLYTGMRTTSCRKLKDAFCKGVYPIEISKKSVKLQLNGEWHLLNSQQTNDLAIADGFNSVADFFSYFSGNNCDRLLICWGFPPWLSELIAEADMRSLRLFLEWFSELYEADHLNLIDESDLKQNYAKIHGLWQKFF